MRVDIGPKCADMCADMCGDMYADICVHRCAVDMCAVDLCADMCVDMRVDMRVGHVCRQVCSRHAWCSGRGSDPRFCSREIEVGEGIGLRRLVYEVGRENA